MARKVIVGSQSGLHARPAAIFTHAVANTGRKITIARPGGEPVDAASILMVLSQGIRNGHEVILDIAEHDPLLVARETGAEIPVHLRNLPDDDAALSELAALLEVDLDISEVGL